MLPINTVKPLVVSILAGAGMLFSSLALAGVQTSASAADYSVESLFTDEVIQEIQELTQDTVRANNPFEAMIATRNEFLIAAQDSAKAATLTHKALTIVVRLMVEAVRREGHADFANRKWQEWQNQFQFGMGILAIGDFQPMNQWLADFYADLIDLMGKERLEKITLINEVNTMNHAIPVALHPKGNPKTGEKWDIADYRLHFVPFAAIGIGYGTLAACMVITRVKPEFAKYGKFCKPASQILRNVTAQFLAPKLADAIFTRTHRNSSKAVWFSRSELRYENGRELQQSLR